LTNPILTIIGKYLDCLNKHNGTFPTLTIRGFVVLCADKVTNVKGKKFDWEKALIDAAITSGVTFFSALGGGAVAGINGINLVEAATIAALSQFFVFLALKRGLVKPEERKPQ